MTVVPQCCLCFIKNCHFKHAAQLVHSIHNHSLKGLQVLAIQTKPHRNLVKFRDIAFEFFAPSTPFLFIAASTSFSQLECDPKRHSVRRSVMFNAHVWIKSRPLSGYLVTDARSVFFPSVDLNRVLPLEMAAPTLPSDNTSIHMHMISRTHSPVCLVMPPCTFNFSSHKFKGIVKRCTQWMTRYQSLGVEKLKKCLRPTLSPLWANSHWNHTDPHQWEGLGEVGRLLC